MVATDASGTAGPAAVQAPFAGPIEQGRTVGQPARGVAVQAGPPRAAESGGPDTPWPITVSRQLRSAGSVEKVMQYGCELAPCVTGCTQAVLVTDKARPTDGGKLPDGALRSDGAKLIDGALRSDGRRDAFPRPQVSELLAALLAHDCLSTARTIVIADADSDGRLQTVLAATKQQHERPAAAIAAYLPDGAGRRPAALILSYDQVNGLDADALELATAYAEVVNTAVAHQHANEQLVSLRAALESNREIGTAMGILMTTHKVSAEEAFALLRSASQHTHRKLSAIAAEVVYTGILPA